MQEALSAIGFDIQVAVVNLINFAIIFFLLNKYLFPQIKKGINDRKKLISEGVENATRANTAFIQARAESDAIIKKAKEEAFVIISDATNKAQLVQAEFLKKAEKDAESLRLDTEKKLQKESRIHRERLARESVDAVVQAAGKLAQKEIMTEAEHRSLVSKLILQ